MDVLFVPFFGVPLIVIVMVVIGFIGMGVYMLRRFMRLFKKLVENPKSKLSVEDKRKVALSAIYGEQQVAYTNDLKTGVPVDKIFGIFQLFGIDAMTKKMRKEELVKVLEDLLEDGVLHGHYSEENISQMKSFGMIKEASEAEEIDIIAWHLGRAVLLARFGYDVKIFDESEAMGYLTRAYQIAVKHYDSWESYGIGYNAGRMDWSNNDEFHSVFDGYRKLLLSDERSPWLKVSFK